VGLVGGPQKPITQRLDRGARLDSTAEQALVVAVVAVAMMAVAWLVA